MLHLQKQINHMDIRQQLLNLVHPTTYSGQQKKTTAMKPNKSSQVTQQVFDSRGNFLRTQEDCQHIHSIAAYSTLTKR